MLKNLGTWRSLGGKDLLPIFSWQLNANQPIESNEMLLRVTDLHLESANYKQIYSECGGNSERIKENVLLIINNRGKLHNPYTETGGLMSGVIEEIGECHSQKANFSVGDEVLILTSATTIPLKIDKINSIDLVYGHMEVEGHAILFDRFSMVKKPSHLPIKLLMLAFEESSSVHHANLLSKDVKKVLVLGSDPVTTMLYGTSIRESLEEKGTLIAVLQDNNNDPDKKHFSQYRELLLTVFDYVHTLNLADPVSTAAVLDAAYSPFPLTINSADVLGAESVAVLCTENKGVIFTSTLLNNYHYALFLAEAIKREFQMLCADGYAENYDAFMVSLLEKWGDKIQALSTLMTSISGESHSSKEAAAYSDVSMDSLENHQMISSSMGLVFQDKNIQGLVEQVLKVAKYECPVLILGETGVGKERFARILHSYCNRKYQPFIKINCAAISSALMESEFFGYEPGAFTGAHKDGKKGYFELANNGTLLLDEISELPLDMQAKLLRVLQDGEFYRVGGEAPVKSDVRVLVASNRSLKGLIEEGAFREDLYYRLAVYIISIPPLRDRPSDIFPLVEHFMKIYREMYRSKVNISNEALALLLKYNWPGNIRELDNVVHRLIINSKSNTINQDDVYLELFHNPVGDSPEPSFLVNQEPLSYKEYFENQEKEFFKNYLEKYKSTRKAAEAMGIAQSQFMRKKKKYNL
jgi:transcriptional regulator with PAS, ATPase and Fis domain